MARTAHTRARAKRRERLLGTAIGLGVLTTFGVGLLILIVQLLIPGSTLHNFTSLVLHASSATLPLDPLYQQWAEKIQEEDVLFATPLSLFCGGLVLGRLAPRYVASRSVLIAGALMGFGDLVISLGFVWPTAVINQNILNHNEGGQQVRLNAPLELVAYQILWGIAWITLCVLGTWLGLRWRDRRSENTSNDTTSTASPSAAQRLPLT